MNHAPYREMLEAAALNLLDGATQGMFDEHVTCCRRCEDEFTAYRTIVAMLAYTIKPVAPPARLRARLYERVMQMGMDESSFL